jgi:hypothetical protein
MGHSVANKIFARICTERSPCRTIEANLLDVPAGGHIENSPSSQTAVSLYVEKVSYNSSTTHIKTAKFDNNNRDVKLRELFMGQNVPVVVRKLHGFHF